MNPHQSAVMVLTLQRFGMVFTDHSHHCGGLWSSYLRMDSHMIGSLSRFSPANLLSVFVGLAGSRSSIWDAVGISIVMVLWFILPVLSGRVNSCASVIVILTNSNPDSHVRRFLSFSS